MRLRSAARPTINWKAIDVHRIAINGINSRTGGGKSILNNYLRLLETSASEDRYYLLTADPQAFGWVRSRHIEVVGLPKGYGTTISSPFVNELILDNVLRQLRIDVLFNVGNLLVRTKVKQVYLFHWPYAIYPDDPVWARMDRADRFIRRVKLLLFKRGIGRPMATIAQTAVAKEALERLYGLGNVRIIPNAVSLDNLDIDSGKKYDLPVGKRLLYLTHYYPHKNLEILLPVARIIRRIGCPYRIITTIDGDQHRGARRLLRKIREEGLDGIIANVGAVAMRDVPSLYRSCDGLLMPTLMESFSGTYVEAMFHKIPIFTSDRDFARAVCKDAACYFDPDDPEDILRRIEDVFGDGARMSAMIRAGQRTLRSFPEWPDTFKLYQEVIREGLRRDG